MQHGPWTPNRPTGRMEAPMHASIIRSEDHLDEAGIRSYGWLWLLNKKPVFRLLRGPRILEGNLVCMEWM